MLLKTSSKIPMMFKEMLALMVVGTAAALSLSFTGSPTQTQAAVSTDAAATAEFSKRMASYVELQKKNTAALPKVPDKATPEQLYAHKIALAKLMTAARKTAKKGDVFGPDMPAAVRRWLSPMFKGPDGDNLRKTIHDEPHPVVPAVNVRYPDDVPLSTMPPDVLKLLPKLEDTLEYRFIGRHLILLDVAAHLIVDIVDNAIPA